MGRIHDTAIVDKGAQLGRNVSVGPYCVVGPNVELGDGVTLTSHVAADGHTAIGANTKIYPFAAVGFAPQNLKYKGEPTRLVIGNNTVIREHVTLHPGTAGGGGITTIGNNCLLMVGSHVAHDCRVGDHVMMANNATLGGHVVVDDHAVLGGLCAVHQFVRIGRHAMIGGMSGVEYDVIPYGSVAGNRATLSGLNIIGLKRRGFDRKQIHDLRAAYRSLFANEGTMSERLADVADAFQDNEAVMEIVTFMRDDSSRPVSLPKPSRAA